jgi:hypothetical protein
VERFLSLSWRLEILWLVAAAAVAAWMDGGR